MAKKRGVFLRGAWYPNAHYATTTVAPLSLNPAEILIETFLKLKIIQWTNSLNWTLQSVHLTLWKLVWLIPLQFFSALNTFSILPPWHGRKLNVHKKFRRRLGRLMSVLCTFNLCAVSRVWFVFLYVRCVSKILEVFSLC